MAKNKPEAAPQADAVSEPVAKEPQPSPAAGAPEKAWLRANIRWLMAELDWARAGRDAEERAILNP